jgi:hypothetical protein
MTTWHFRYLLLAVLWCGIIAVGCADPSTNPVKKPAATAEPSADLVNTPVTTPTPSVDLVNTSVTTPTPSVDLLFALQTQQVEAHWME